MQSRQSTQELRRNRLSEAGRRGSWRRWHRERQIVALLPVVDRIAKKVRWMFAPHLEFGDLTQAGTVGLVSAANTYDPSRGAFEPYAYFRVRGAIIDSQKRRVYREERNVSLHAIAEAHNGWVPPALDTDTRPLPDAEAERNEIHQMLAEAIAALPRNEQRVMRCHLAGQSLTSTALEVGSSLAWTRATLAEAKLLVGAAMRSDGRIT